jgi:hypothetical protein
MNEDGRRKKEHDGRDHQDKEDEGLLRDHEVIPTRLASSLLILAASSRAWKGLTT